MRCVPSRTQQSLNGSGRLVNEILGSIAVTAGGCAGDAVMEMLIEQFDADALQGLADRGDLCEHVDAIRAVLDHSAQAPNLALDTAQARQQLLLVLGVSRCRRVHTAMIPRGGISATASGTVAVARAPLLQERSNALLRVVRRCRPRHHIDGVGISVRLAELRLGVEPLLATGL